MYLDVRFLGLDEVIARLLVLFATVTGVSRFVLSSDMNLQKSIIIVTAPTLQPRHAYSWHVVCPLGYVNANWSFDFIFRWQIRDSTLNHR